MDPKNFSEVLDFVPLYCNTSFASFLVKSGMQDSAVITPKNYKLYVPESLHHNVAMHFLHDGNDWDNNTFAIAPGCYPAFWYHPDNFKT